MFVAIGFHKGKHALKASFNKQSEKAMDVKGNSMSLTKWLHNTLHCFINIANKNNTHLPEVIVVVLSLYKLHGQRPIPTWPVFR